MNNTVQSNCPTNSVVSCELIEPDISKIFVCLSLTDFHIVRKINKCYTQLLADGNQTKIAKVIEEMLIKGYQKSMKKYKEYIDSIIVTNTVEYRKYIQLLSTK